jgi:hypothetical protein
MAEDVRQPVTEPLGDRVLITEKSPWPLPAGDLREVI